MTTITLADAWRYYIVPGFKDEVRLLLEAIERGELALPEFPALTAPQPPPTPPE